MEFDPELRRLANELIQLVHRTVPSEPVFPLADHRAAVDTDHESLAKLAVAMLRIRRLRADYLPDQLFGEPAWDMLLDLYVHRCQNERISITSACIAAAVPSTTALRWITELIEKGLAQREEDEHDRRRAFLRLTDKGAESVAQTLLRAHQQLRSLFTPAQSMVRVR